MNRPSAVKPSWGHVTTEALKRFRAEFQVYFPAAFVASLVAYLCVYFLESIREKLAIAPSYESVMEPEIDDENVSIGQSFRNSIRATAGWEIFFFLEFGILGLVGGTLYFAGQDFLAQRLKHAMLTSSGYELTLAAFTILLASVALTLLALVHSLVYISIRYGTATLLVKTADADV
jgi:hypothetical protein